MAEIHHDLTSREVRDELRISNKKYWDLANEGELDIYYVGRTTRATRASVDALKKRNPYIPRKNRGAI
jgi:hypothetical protein